MKIGFFPNPSRDKGLDATKGLINRLLSCDVECYISDGMRAEYNVQANVCADIFGETDAVVVLGGDGSFLGAARRAADYGTPLLGVNLGGLGYLTDCGAEEAHHALERLISGDYHIEERLMIECLCGGESMSALNDVIISAIQGKTVVNLELYIDGKYIETLLGDGLLISTPTGSTAYNLSAGGPILPPDSQALVITPVCAHNLYVRPIVVSERAEIRVRSVGENGARAIADGQESIPLPEGGDALITRLARKTKIIRTTSLGFYDILRQKLLGTGGRGR